MPTLAELIQAESPLGYWRLNEPSGTTLNDASGNARHGSYVGAPSFQQAGLDDSEPANKAVSFPSSSAYATIPHSSAYNVLPWALHYIARSSLTSAFVAARDAEGSDGTLRYFRVGYNSVGKVIAAWVRSGAGYNIFSQRAFNDGARHHVVVTITSNNLMRLWVDGRLEGMRQLAGSWPSGSQRLLLSRGELGNAIQGPVDEVALLNRWLLTAKIREMASAALSALGVDHYRAAVFEAEGDTASSVLRGYWPLDDASGAAVDVGPHVLNGTYSSVVLGQAGLAQDGSNATSVRFTSSSSNVEVPTSTQYQTTPITLAAVVKPNAIPGGTRVMRIADRDNGSTQRHFQLRMEPSGKFSFIYFLGGTPHSAIGTTVAVAGQTYHVAATYDGSNLRLFVNGVLEATTPASGSTVNTITLPIRIGNSNGSDPATTAWWDGWLQHFTLHSAVLSDATIARMSRQAVGIMPVAGGASLTGAATVSASATGAWMGSAALTGQAGVTTAAIISLSGAAALAGSGGLTAETAAAYEGASALTGVGSIAVAASREAAGGVVLAGTGALAAAALAEAPGAATLPGSGAFSAVSTGVAEGQAALAAAGSLAASGGRHTSATATLEGRARVDIDLVPVFSGWATLSGRGTVTVDGFALAPASSQLVGTGHVQTSAGRITHAGGPLAGRAALTAAGRLVAFGSFSVGGEGQLDPRPWAILVLDGTANLLGEGRIAVAGTVVPVILGAATLGGVASLGAVPFVPVLGQTDLWGGGYVLAGGEVRSAVEGDGVLTGVGTLYAIALGNLVVRVDGTWPSATFRQRVDGQWVPRPLRRRVGGVWTPV